MERIMPLVGMILILGFIGFLPFLGIESPTGNVVGEKANTLTSQTSMKVRNCLSSGDVYDPMKKGSVVFSDEGKDYRWYDECLSEERFLEYSCDGEDELIITEGLCANGCKDGHCI